MHNTTSLLKPHMLARIMRGKAKIYPRTYIKPRFSMSAYASGDAGQDCFICIDNHSSGTRVTSNHRILFDHFTLGIPNAVDLH